GRVPHEEVGAYYGAIDLFVLPRRPTRLTDAVTPLKPLEIMARAKPLVASDCGGHRELVVEGTNGFLFPASSEGALADTIARLAAQPEALRELGTAARRWVAAHRSWRTAVAPTVELYTRLAGRAADVRGAA